MKIALATLAVVLGLASAVLPASADYKNPNHTRLQQALENGY